jgi:mannose-1-phosphate guanylyltransferase / mannose-6-phosphate isomerase
MREIIPLVLCGGSGSRLWPLSQVEKPKQFLEIAGMPSTFAQTLARCSGDGFSAKPIIVTAKKQACHVATALGTRNQNADVVLEPVRRDSCAAVVVGTLTALARDADALVLVVASDHLIPDAAAFRASVEIARHAAESGFIVTFGVAPTEPATGYGYLAPSEECVDGSIMRIASFTEKPDLETASNFIAKGYLWNSGNFLFRARDLLSEVNCFAPDIYRAAQLALQAAKPTDGGLELNEEAFSAAPRISFDHAIMEKTAKASVLPVSYAWRDLGTWDAVAEVQIADAESNSVLGQVMINNSRNCMVISDQMPLILVGCEDLIVVATAKGILVARKGMTQNLKLLADPLASMCMTGPLIWGPFKPCVDP